MELFHRVFHLLAFWVLYSLAVKRLRCPNVFENTAVLNPAKTDLRDNLCRLLLREIPGGGDETEANDFVC